MNSNSLSYGEIDNWSADKLNSDNERSIADYDDSETEMVTMEEWDAQFTK